MFDYERLRNAGVSDVARGPGVVMVRLMMMLLLLLLLAEYCGHGWCCVLTGCVVFPWLIIAVRHSIFRMLSRTCHGRCVC
jgi:hypothetical protein